MDARLQPPAESDWHVEQTAQRRDVVRFGAELDRMLAMKSHAPAARTTTEQLREHWERLKRRLDGRWARAGDLWDSQNDLTERLRRDHDRLLALVDLDDQLAGESDLALAMKGTLRCVARSVACDGTVIVLYDASGLARRISSEKSRGRKWPSASDQELLDILIAGTGSGRRILIEGRPVGAGPREKGRASHWLACPVTHGTETYGAIIVGRSLTELGFIADDAQALLSVCKRLGRYASAKLGIAARPILAAGPKPEGFEQIWGQSPSLKKAVALAANYALSDTPILIEGEPGTGRKTLARAIHRRSARAEKPFVAVAAANLPEDVVMRTLFGIRITNPDGSVDERPGDVELAAGGTLFIDEIATFGPVAQVRLLRLLQDGVFEREGDRTARQSAIRLIVGTSTDLDRSAVTGSLRPDLYYQITVARVVLPPLRERGGDIVELARRFAQAAARRAGREVEGIDIDAARLLAAGTYPGNIGQLAQIIERAVLLARGSLVTVADLPASIPTTMAAATSSESASLATETAAAIRAAVTAGQSGDYSLLKRAKKNAVAVVEYAFVETVMKVVGRNSSRAARHCGIHRAQWQRLLHAARGGAEPDNSELFHNTIHSTKTDT